MDAGVKLDVDVCVDLEVEVNVGIEVVLTKVISVAVVDFEVVKLGPAIGVAVVVDAPLLEVAATPNI